MTVKFWAEDVARSAGVRSEMMDGDPQVTIALTQLVL
jgi:hypothetical protein